MTNNVFSSENDVLDAIINQKLKPAIHEMLRQFSGNFSDSNHYDDTLKYLNIAINHDRKEFMEKIGIYQNSDDSGKKNTFLILNIISQYCNGEIEEETPLYNDYIEFIEENTTSEKIKLNIGKYFKEQLKSYLEESKSMDSQSPSPSPKRLKTTDDTSQTTTAASSTQRAEVKMLGEEGSRPTTPGI